MISSTAFHSRPDHNGSNTSSSSVSNTLNDQSADHQAQQLDHPVACTTSGAAMYYDADHHRHHHDHRRMDQHMAAAEDRYEH
jgi:hypothetical protein